jgi:hypothetical protein
MSRGARSSAKRSWRGFCLARYATATLRTAIVLIGLGACSINADSNPASRCDTLSDCGDAQKCHAGFCVGGTERQEDPASSLDGGAGRDGGLDASTTNPGSADAGAPLDESDDDTSDGAVTGDGGTPTDDGASSDDADDGAGSCWRLAPCGGRCVDLQSSPDHCGSCGNACSGNRRCVTGVCCKSGESACSGECVNLKKDKKNCGACGNQCSHGSCKDGLCKDES